MPDARVSVTPQALQQMQENLGTNAKLTDITKDALTMFNWAVSEVAKGNVIISSNEDGTKMTRLALPSLEGIHSRRSK